MYLWDRFILPLKHNANSVDITAEIKMLNESGLQEIIQP